MSDEEDDRKRVVEYSFGSNLVSGQVYASVVYLDDIKIQIMWPYALHEDLLYLSQHMPELLDGARVHYETALGSKEIDKDLEALFGKETPDE